MQSVTLTVAAIFSVLVFILPPAYALVVYITSLLWYPSFLVMSIGTIDISVGRFVVAALFLRCLCERQIMSKFVWSRLDTLITLSIIVYVAVYCITFPLFSAIENRGGFLMDTWFAYMVTRFIVTDEVKLISILKCIGVVLVPLAILGMIESTTGWQPFAPLRRFCPWSGLYGREAVELVPGIRFGFARAVGPHSHPILFGCAFALFLPLIYFLRRQKGDWSVLAYVLSAVALIGALSSMSSGPWVMVIVAVFCLAMERYPYFVKPLVAFFIFSCISVGLISNRPFYHVIASYANPLGGAGWHRARLIDLAIEHVNEWWLVGYGARDPGWGSSLGMGHTDVTNQFILAGVRYGVLGMILLCAVLVVAFHGLIRAYQRQTDPQLKSLYWSLGSVLVSVTVAWMSVSFFGQLEPLFYCVLGMIGSSFFFAEHSRTEYGTLLIGGNFSSRSSGVG